jgi:hypothetical protein
MNGPDMTTPEGRAGLTARLAAKGRDPLVYRDDWWQRTRCPYCGAGPNEPCRSKTTNNTISPHMARLERAIRERKEKDK